MLTALNIILLAVNAVLMWRAQKQPSLKEILDGIEGLWSDEEENTDSE